MSEIFTSRQELEHCEGFLFVLRQQFSVVVTVTHTAT